MFSNLIRTVTNSTLFRSAGIYTLSKIINSAIPFLMLPVLTRYLTPTDYGIVAMFYVLVGIVSPFIGLSIHGSIGVKYFYKNETDLSNYIGNSLFLLLLSSVCVSAVIWIFAAPISRLLSFPKEWLWAAIVIAVGQFVMSVQMTLWQVEHRAVQYGVFQNLQTLLNLGLSILLIVGMGMNWKGRIDAQIASVFVFACASLFILYRDRLLKFRFDWVHIKYALGFGIPLIPHDLGAMVITQTDRIFITNMVSIADAGIYTVGFQIAYLIELVASAFNQAYSPWLFRHLKEDTPGMKDKIVKFTYVYFVLILSAAVLFSFFVPLFLRYMVGKDFIMAGKYTFWIALGFAFSGMYYMVANYIFFVGRTAPLAWVTFFTALLNVLFNYVLITMNGAVGAAQASALAYFLSFIFTWILSAKVYAMPWNLKKLLA
ncbi:MAG: oligosaccharide flippase family protein [Nitrospirae bacterium]|nr:oligosaccharide flippase family protein [Nitrospirota bacterium]